VERARKKKPVTLVAVVVRRKSAVRPAAFREPGVPNKAKIPDAIATRLKPTCTDVKVDTDIPRITTHLLSSNQLKSS